MEQDQREQREEKVYRRQAETDMYPVSNQEQLGQDILRTTARFSDPDMIEYRTIKMTVPKLEKKNVLDEKGKEVEVEVIVGYEEKEWKEPIRVQSKYHEPITDDISRAFLSFEDYMLYQDNISYCLMIKSFANRYGLDLAIHYNNVIDDNNTMVVGSGAVKGRRVMIAKSNIAETSYKESIMQQTQPEGKKKKFLGII